MQELPFPLNHYLRAITEAYGSVASSTFGYYIEGSNTPITLPEAQQALLDKIAQLISEQPARGRVLLYGDQLGNLAYKLSEFSLITLLSPSGQYAAFPDQEVKVSESQLETVSGELADFNSSVRYDWIIIPRTINYSDLLFLTQVSLNLLTPRGCLLWVGELLKDNSTYRYSALPFTDTFENLAERLGFELFHKEEMTHEVLPGVIEIQRLLLSNKEQCAGSSTDDLIRAENSIAQLKESFASGQSGCFLYVLSKAHEVRTATQSLMYLSSGSFPPAEYAHIFQSSFNQPFNEKVWRWKYQSGKGIGLIATVAGSLVGHYGGVPRQIEFFGEPALALQICDVMVLPEQRRKYGKDSLFFKLAATFLEREIGNSVVHLLGFGFPNLKAMRMATRLGLYEKTDDFVEIHYPSDTSLKVAENPIIIKLDPDNSQHTQTVDRLWASMRNALTDSVIGLRDFNYISYRYLEHPIGDYHCLLVQPFDESDPVALVVVKEFEGALLLMDIVADPVHFPRAIEMIIIHCAEQFPHQILRCRITGGWHELVMIEGATLNHIGIEIPCHSWTKGPSASTLRGKWWLTAGDMDFI